MVLCCTFLTTISSNPLETVVDITNDFSICILQLIASPRTNAVFSPYGLTSVVVLIHEGANSSSSSAQQIRQTLKMPNNSDLTQLGFRDLHRYLKSYFTSDGFLRGLILSNPKAVLSQDYLKTLKYYGFEPDISIEQLNVRESPITTKSPQNNNNNTVLQIPVKNTTNIRQKDKVKEPIQEESPLKSENITNKINDSVLELTTINPTTTTCKDGSSNDGETVCPTMETPLNLPTQINFSTTEDDIPESKTTTESSTRDIEPTTMKNIDETTTKTPTTVIKKSTTYPKTDSTNFNEILETSSSGTQSTTYIEPKTIEIQSNTFNEITTESIIPNSDEASTEYILGEFTLSEPVHLPIPSIIITTPKTIEPHEDGFYHEDEEYDDDNKNKLDQIPSWKTSGNIDENIMTTSMTPTPETFPTIVSDEDLITTTESTVHNIKTESTIRNDIDDGNNFTEIIKNFDSTTISNLMKEELNDDSKLSENQFNNFKNIEENLEMLNEFIKTDQTISIPEIIETIENLTTTEMYEQPITTTENSFKNLEIDVNRTSKSLDPHDDDDDDKKSRDDDFERNLNLLFEDINKILNSSKPINNTFDDEFSKEILNIFPKENFTDSKESTTSGNSESNSDLSNDLIKLFNSTPNSETESIELNTQTTPKIKNDFDLNDNDDEDDDDDEEDLMFSEANDSLIDTSELMKLFNFNFDDFKNYDFDDHEYNSKNDDNNDNDDDDTDNLTTRERRSIQDSRFRMANWLEENRYNQSPTTQWFTSFTNKQLVPMLTVKAFLPFADIPSMDAQAIQIPLDVDYYTMLIVLPKTRMGLKQLLYSLQWCSIREIIASLRTTPIYAEIPTFTMVHHVNLVEPLIKLGIRDIFSPKTAQLTVMSKDPNLFVRSVEQIVTISVREHYNNNNQHRWYDATESQIQQHFLATHPFVFFVVDTETKVSLVAGTIVDPTLRSTGM